MKEPEKAFLGVEMGMVQVVGVIAAENLEILPDRAELMGDSAPVRN